MGLSTSGGGGGACRGMPGGIARCTGDARIHRVVQQHSEKPDHIICRLTNLLPVTVAACNRTAAGGTAAATADQANPSALAQLRNPCSAL